MQYLFILAIIIVVIWLAIQLLIWLVTTAIPAAAGFLTNIFLLVLGVALVGGVIRGLYKGFSGYYSTLTDVYGTRRGKILGVVLTLVWIGILLFFGRMAILAVVDQYQQLQQSFM